MPLEYMLMYFVTLGFVGFGGALAVDIVDRKSDEMAGFREKRIRKKVR